MATGEIFRILEHDAQVLRPELVPSPEVLEQLYRAMRRARHFDDKAMTLQRQGKLGVFPPFAGQEAAQVGSALALDPGDWLAPSYRETAAALAFGLPLARAILYWRTNPHGFAMSDELNLLPFYVPIATQLPHAAGIALAGKLQGKGWVALTYVGDGGTSEGDFHTGLNFAAVFAAPAVFFVQNNGWAISGPTHAHTRAESIAARGIGYGIPGIRVDGNDVLAVYYVTKEAVARARAGEGPSLIEAVTYRVKPHTTSDDTSRYRDEEEATHWQAERDPLKRMRTYLETRGLWDASRETEFVAKLDEELAQAIQEADTMPEPTPGEILEHVFATMTDDLLAQQKFLEQELIAKESRA